MSESELNEVLTTQQAANVLGLSVSSVQKMVINGELEAWITPGGHRRILRRAVEQMKSARVPTSPPSEKAARRAMKVVLAEDDPVQVQFFRSIIAKCGFPVDVTVAIDASMALIQLERLRPDLVVTDLVMEPFDGFHLIRTLGMEPTYYPIDVIVLSAMRREEAMAVGNLPDWVTYYQKPVHAERLIGYLDALQTRVIKRLSA